MNSSDGTREPRPCFLIVPAAGSGRRMGTALPKQYLPLAGKPVLRHTLERVGMLSCFDRVLVVLAEDDSYWPALAAGLEPALLAKIGLVTGGAKRADSVACALASLRDKALPEDWIVVHDAVRPCVAAEDIRRLLTELDNERAGGLLATPVRETLKESQDGRLVARTVQREHYWQAATPQMFRYGVLQQALELAKAQGREVTDEAAAVEALGLPVRLVPCRADNIKITSPEDLVVAETVLATHGWIN